MLSWRIRRRERRGRRMSLGWCSWGVWRPFLLPRYFYLPRLTHVSGIALKQNQNVSKERWRERRSLEN